MNRNSIALYLFYNWGQFFVDRLYLIKRKVKKKLASEIVGRRPNFRLFCQFVFAHKKQTYCSVRRRERSWLSFFCVKANADMSSRVKKSLLCYILCEKILWKMDGERIVSDSHESTLSLMITQTKIHWGSLGIPKQNPHDL